jgi:hypothetical protein
VLYGQFKQCWLVLLYRTFVLDFHINVFVIGSSSVGMSLILQFLDLSISILAHFFQIQEFDDLLENLSPISFIHYTLFKIGKCIGIEFYNKLKLMIV